MWQYLYKKLLILLFSVFCVMSLTFGLMHCIPGDPFGEEVALPQEVLQNIRASYHLEDSLWQQYIHYCGKLCTGDWGTSLRYEGRDTLDIICKAFPTSLLLGSVAFSIALFWGLMWGGCSALLRNRSLQNIISLGTVLGLCIPSFMAAVGLQYTFAITLKWFPIAQWGSWRHLVLPALSLALYPAATVARLFRTQVLEVSKQEYILTAKMKNLPPHKIFLCHILKNSVLPLLPYLGTLFTHIITGSLITERIFGIPGLGNWFTLSILNRDYPLILGLVFFYSVLLITLNIFMDILCAILDPRIRHEHKTTLLLS